jgi:hypothetical protein
LKRMKIYLDFDGTVVQHRYPAIGEYNPGAFDVVKKLIAARHEVVLNTYRANLNAGHAAEAQKYVLDGVGANIPVLSQKAHPKVWEWAFHFMFDEIFIDDSALGCPLRSDVRAVDWARIDLEFKANGIY